MVGQVQGRSLAGQSTEACVYWQLGGEIQRRSARGFPGSGQCLTRLVGLSTPKLDQNPKAAVSLKSNLFTSSPPWVYSLGILVGKAANAVTLRSAIQARPLGHCGELFIVMSLLPTDDDCQQTCFGYPQRQQNSTKMIILIFSVFA